MRVAGLGFGLLVVGGLGWVGVGMGLWLGKVYGGAVRVAGVGVGVRRGAQRIRPPPAMSGENLTQAVWLRSIVNHNL